MRQFAGHWYSGRAARLCAVEAALVAVALWVTGRNAGNGRALAALIGAAACIPAALYLADLYDPQVMRNDRARGSATLKALGASQTFVARIVLSQALICGVLGSILGLSAAIPSISYAKSLIPWIYAPWWLPGVMVVPCRW